MAMYETKGTGTGPRGEFQIKDLEEFCRRMRNAGASGTEIVKARVRFGGSVSELTVKINTNPLGSTSRAFTNPISSSNLGELSVANAKLWTDAQKPASGEPNPDVRWWCPKKGCDFRAMGDIDSPYDADLCPTHHEKIVKIDDM